MGYLTSGNVIVDAMGSINISGRLFTVLYGGKALKVGRVQTPTLAMLVDREAKIMNFKKEAAHENNKDMKEQEKSKNSHREM